MSVFRGEEIDRMLVRLIDGDTIKLLLLRTSSLLLSGTWAI